MRLFGVLALVCAATGAEISFLALIGTTGSSSRASGLESSDEACFVIGAVLSVAAAMAATSLYADLGSFPYSQYVTAAAAILGALLSMVGTIISTSDLSKAQKTELTYYLAMHGLGIAMVSLGGIFILTDRLQDKTNFPTTPSTGHIEGGHTNADVQSTQNGGTN